MLQSLVSNLLRVESETFAFTMNETIPVLLGAGVVSTFLIGSFIAFAAFSILRGKKD